MGIEKFRRRVSMPGVAVQAKWAGTATVNSGSTSTVVSASQVASGDVILTSIGITAVASHRGLITSVDSVVGNTSFCIVTDLAPNGGNLQVNYVVLEV